MRFLLLLVLLFSACHTKKNKAEPRKEELFPEPGVCYVNLVDTVIHTPIGHGFYKNERGEIFERKSSKEVGIDSVFICDYLDSTLVVNEDGLPSRLRSYLDVKSYEEFATPPFSRDRKHVYFFHLTEYGGTRYLVKYADPKTFEHVYGYWAKDKYHVFYKTNIVKMADPSTFRTMNWDSAADRKHTYVNGSRVD